MHLKQKIGQINFRGNIKHNPLPLIVNYITFSCILSAKKGDDTGSLFFKNGELIGAELNNNFHIDKAKDILSWKEGTYYYQKWISDFKIKQSHLSSILYYIEICNFNIELSFTFKNQLLKIICSEGIIVEIEPKPKNLDIFFTEIIKETKGVISIQKRGGQTGSLKEYYSEYLNSETNILNQQSKQKNKVEIISKSLFKKRKKQNIYKEFNNKMFQKTFDHLKQDMKDVFIAGSIYSARLGKPIYSFNASTNQTILFAKLHLTLNNLLSNANFGTINNFYILDLEEDYLLFVLTFKEHHYGLAFDKSKVKLGYLLNIIKPIIINDYENALQNF